MKKKLHASKRVILATKHFKIDKKYEIIECRKYFMITLDTN